MFDHRKTRPFTAAVLDAVDLGNLDKDALIADLLGWMSESEVEQFVRANDHLAALGMDDDDQDDDDGQPFEDQEWESFDPDC